MHSNKDQELIKACIGNSRKAQKALYDRFASQMYVVALRYVGDTVVAQDVLQDAFVKVFSSLDTYTGAGSLEGWVRRIVINTALENLRSNDVLSESVELDDVLTVPDANISVIEKISGDELMSVIASLPVGFRTVFNMYAIEGYTHKEIAHQLGITESTSRSQYNRARILIQQKLEKLLDIWPTRD